MIKVINLSEEQVSFLFNNLDITHYQDTAWYKLMDDLNWDKDNDCYVSRPLLLNDAQIRQFMYDMECNTVKILEEVKLDVLYHVYNDTSWANMKWCLERTSDIIYLLKHAEEVEVELA